MQKRTDSEKLSMAPLTLTFGKAKYKVNLLGMEAQWAWRELMSTEMREIVKGYRPVDNSEATAAMAASLTQSLIKFPQVMLKLLFAYGPDLPADTIKTDATEEQVVLAFSQVMEVAYPFLASLVVVAQAVRSEAIASL